eukprot:TRINITY_DN21710_c0_g1_i1.p1 TRINITY_DN21710_c0_g1~~TRINITY_DN21710_c0_g1_i1.p1  ORF type:complete len:545 (-),score=81.26 TRINITY_DN21710_c0_g1_i1:137-1654(-)
MALEVVIASIPLWRVALSKYFHPCTAFVLLLTMLSSALGELSYPEPSPPPPPCDIEQIQVEEECPGALPPLPGSDTGPLTWTEANQRLYASRALLFGGGIGLHGGGPAAAVAAVHDLLRTMTGRFSEAFACTPAIVATFSSLARLLAMQGRIRRSLAMLHLGFIFVRDRGFTECTPWPVQGWDMMLAGERTTARVRALDTEAVLDVPHSYRGTSDGSGATLRVAVVTICAYAEDEPVRVFCRSNRRLYSLLHGYDVHFFTDASEIEPHQAAAMNVLDGVHKPFFWKVNAVKNVLDTGRYDWVLWMDCDAFFMDPSRTIDSVIAAYVGNGTLATRGKLPADASGQLRQRFDSESSTAVSLILVVDSTGLNNGVWLMRNSPWSHKFLTDWWHSDILSGPGRAHNCSDQSTMLHMLLYERAMHLDDAWDAIEGPVWPPEVRVAKQEDLQSFHDATAATALSRAWRDGDFIKHHPGCHYYKAPCQYLFQEAENTFQQKVTALQAKLALR